MTQVPDKIGKYRILSEVARGGMGAVYKAEHPTLGRPVIIKKLTIRGSSSVRERFRREASIMMDFRNEYIVDVYDHFREGPAYYIVQEYVDGMPLSELLYRERYLPERIALLIVRGCCNALKYAHDRGVIHRDIKPANILISHKGEVKLVDFGIARTEDSAEENLTREGMTLGTPSYMAPEQFRDTRSVDRRADIYSLGVMLYEMVTGRRPFPGSFSPATIRKIQHGRCLPPRKQNPSLSRFVDRLIRKAMRVNRSRRYQDLKEVVARLNRRLRAIDVDDERREIASYVAGRWSPPGYRSLLLRFSPAIVAFLVLLACGVVYLSGGSGLRYALFDRGSYGTLNLAVRVPRASLPLGSALLPATVTRLTAAPSGADPRVLSAGGAGAADAAVELRPNAQMQTEETEVFTKRDIWLPAGAYRISVASAGSEVSRDIFVEPLARQGRDTNSFLLTIPPVSPRRVSVVITAVSASSGGDLTGGVTVDLKIGSAWVPFSGEVATTLRSGATYTFRVSRSGYYSRTYTVALKPLQSVLEINAALDPVAGRVRLASESAGVNITLDGSQLYRAWGPVPRAERLPTLGPKPVDLALAPGVYDLAAWRGGARADYHLTIDSGEQVGLEVVSGSRSGGLEIRNMGYTSLE